MRIFRLVLIVLFLVVLLLAFFYSKYLSIVRAASLNPSFAVTLVDKNPGVTSDMQFRIINPVGSDVITTTTIGIPAGWTIAAGNNIPDGTILGSGSFTANFLTPLTFHFQIKNSTDLRGHVAHLIVECTDTPIPITLDEYIDGNIKDGFVLTLIPVPGSVIFSLPTEAIFTLYGAPDGITFISTSKWQGDYAWDASFNSTFSGTASRSEIINIPSSKTPIGGNVNIALSGGVEVTFASVTGDGLTKLSTSDKAPIKAPGQFQISPNGLFYSISSTATFECPCTVTLPYDRKINSKLGIVHLNTKVDPAKWEDITVEIDEVSHIITGETTKF